MVSEISDLNCYLIFRLSTWLAQRFWGFWEQKVWQAKSQKIFIIWSRKLWLSENIWRKTDKTKTPNTDWFWLRAEFTNWPDTTKLNQCSLLTGSTKVLPPPLLSLNCRYHFKNFIHLKIRFIVLVLIYAKFDVLRKLEYSFLHSTGCFQCSNRLKKIVDHLIVHHWRILFKFTDFLNNITFLAKTEFSMVRMHTPGWVSKYWCATDCIPAQNKFTGKFYQNSRC